MADDEQVWEVGWDGHQLAQRQRFARLTLAEKLDWLEEAQRMVNRLREAKAKPDDAGSADGR